MTGAWRLRAVSVAVGSLLLAAACASDESGGGGITPPPRPPAPTPVYDPTAWVTSSDGTVPVVIIARTVAS